MAMRQFAKLLAQYERSQFVRSPLLKKLSCRARSIERPARNSLDYHRQNLSGFISLQGNEIRGLTLSGLVSLGVLAGDAVWIAHDLMTIASERVVRVTWKDWCHWFGICIAEHAAIEESASFGRNADVYLEVRQRLRDELVAFSSVVIHWKIPIELRGALGTLIDETNLALSLACVRFQERHRQSIADYQGSLPAEFPEANELALNALFASCLNQDGNLGAISRSWIAWGTKTIEYEGMIEAEEIDQDAVDGGPEFPAVDIDNHTLTLRGVIHPLSPDLAHLLHFLVERKGGWATRKQLRQSAEDFRIPLPLRFDKMLARLPEDIVESQSGSTGGYRIRCIQELK